MVQSFLLYICSSIVQTLFRHYCITLWYKHYFCINVLYVHCICIPSQYRHYSCIMYWSIHQFCIPPRYRHRYCITPQYRHSDWITQSRYYFMEQTVDWYCVISQFRHYFIITIKNYGACLFAMLCYTFTIFQMNKDYFSFLSFFFIYIFHFLSGYLL